MWFRTFAVLPLICIASLSSEKSPKYVVTFPAFVQRAKDYPIHLVLFQNETYDLPVSFKAKLTSAGSTVAQQDFLQNTYGLEKHVIPGSAFLNLTEEDTSVVISVEFSETGLDAHDHIDTYPTVLTDRFVFIQTDKAMYKPGQTVLFRVVVLDRELMPVNRQLSVTLKDPRNKIMQSWEDQQLSRGVFNGSYDLSDFLEEGRWTIIVKGDDIPETSKTFVVEQYVLPKYEVSVEFSNGEGKNYWLFNAQNETGYRGFVRAKYTFGKPIRGTAVVTFVRDDYCSIKTPDPIYDYLFDFGDLFDVTPDLPTTTEAGQTTGGPGKSEEIRFELELAGDGSENDGEFVADGLNKKIAGTAGMLAASECKIVFSAEVTDELTGEEISSEGTVSMFRDPFIISVHDSVQKTLKPGLPFTMRFQISDSNGAAVGPGVKVALTVYNFNATNSGYRDSVACGSSGPPHSSIVPASSKEVLTDRDGLVSVKVSVPKGTTLVLFKAGIIELGSAEPVVEFCEEKLPPETEHSLSISLDNTESKALPKVGDSLTFNIEANFEAPMVYFLVAQNGFAFEYKQLHSPTLKNADSTKYSETFQLPLEAAPRCTAIVWTVDNETSEIIADALQFKVDGLAKMNVSGSFSPDRVLPSTKTTLRISTSEPNSLVALLAVDKSVRLLKSGNDITMNDVMQVVSTSAEIDSPVLWRCWQCGWWPSWIDSTSMNSVFQGVGMEIHSNLLSQADYYYYYESPLRLYDDPEYYDNWGGYYAYAAGGGFEYPEFEEEMAMEDFDIPAARIQNQPEIMDLELESAPPPAPPAPPAPPEPKVRVLFPETWLWNQSETNAQGELVLPLTSPDTITTWVTTVFAVGEEQGFGALDDPIELTVFQDFFVDLDIRQPTVIRDEQVEAKAVVFNYQSTKATVRVHLVKSDDFHVSQDKGESFSSADFRETVEVEPNSGESVSVWIKPKTLGTIKLQLKGFGQVSSDAMIKEILVEPEGEVKYANQAVFLNQNAGETMTKTIEISRMLDQVPEETIVEGSKMFQVQAIGDILGPALSQLGSQVRMPTGCGEQTMIIMAPNVFIFKYLKSVDLLTDALKSKTTGFVEHGYKRELTYQREDGGFSAFGNSDPSSSTWLTAFVMRCFAAAKKHVGTVMEQSHIDRAWQFLSQQAQASGMFTEPGRVIHTEMVGGSSSQGNLAAFVYIAAAEADVEMSEFSATKDAIVQLAQGSEDVYQLALISYALSIRSEDADNGRRSLGTLMNMAKKDGDRTYWKRNADDADGDEYYRAQPSGIETAAYALLAELNLNGLSTNATAIGRWLMSQRNSLGGFSSTQDTVVGLQALSELASRMTSDEQDMTIDATLNFDDGEQLTTSFTINSSNSQILQSFDPPRDKQNLRSVSLSVSGAGVGIVQVAMRYNVQDNRVLNTGNFNIVIIREALMARRKRSTNELDIHDPHVDLRACATPTRAESQMVLFEVGIPTGFEGDLAETIKANRDNSGSNYIYESLKRVEAGERKIVFYFDSLEDTNRQICVHIRMTRTMPVKNTKPPMARVYSYYSPANINAVEYKFPGLSFKDPLACQDIRLNVECPL